jgi:biopolymer transport protein ExbD
MAIKMKKKSTSTDMTAMCDVAFLLLTFFILTATAKVPEVMPVDTPASTVQTKLPEKDLATLTVGNGKVFFDVKGKDVRIRPLN